MFGMVFLFGLVSATVTTTLNSPADQSVTFNPSVTFNTTGNTDSGSGIYNLSLWTNSTGIWTLNATINLNLSLIANFTVSSVNGEGAGTDSVTDIAGIVIYTNQSTQIFNVTKGSSDATTAYIRFLNGTTLYTASFSGTVATFSGANLNPNYYYEILAGSGGSPYNRKYGGQSYPTAIGANLKIVSGFQDGGNRTDIADNILTIGSGNTYLTNSTTQTFSKTIDNYTIWNVNTCDATSCSFAPSNYSITYLNNTATYNSTSFDTAFETYSANISSNSSLTNVYLNYSNSIYETTQSGTVWSYSMDVPTSKVGNNLVNWILTYAGTNYSTAYSYQNVTNLQFVLCNATYSTKFLNISFKDENALAVINASVPTSSFTYYIGSGSVNKSLTFSNTTDNYTYTFCSNAPASLNVIPSFQYKQGTTYPQRIWNPSTQIYNSTLTNQILYLLKSTDGIYVTYQVVDDTGSQISGVNVNATRTIEGNTVLVATGTTDAAGLVTFWMNPDFVHTVTFEKSGYTTYTLNHFPTQTSYTVTLGASSSSNVNDYIRGITYTILPLFGTTLNTSQLYNFNMTLNSTYWNLTSWGFSLYGDGVVIGGNVSSSNSGTLTNDNINITNYEHIYITYYWITNGTTTSATNKGWFTFDYGTGTGWSIWNFFKDLSTYANQGIFGLTQNALNFIIFMFIFVVVGIMSWKFGINSPAAVSGMVLGLVFLFDVGLNLLNVQIFGGIDHFPTIFVGLVTVALIIKEATT